MACVTNILAFILCILSSWKILSTEAEKRREHERRKLQKQKPLTLEAGQVSEVSQRPSSAARSEKESTKPVVKKKKQKSFPWLVLRVSSDNFRLWIFF